MFSERNRLSFQLAGHPAEIAKEIDHKRSLGPGLGTEGIARIESGHAGDLLYLRLQGIGNLEHRFPPVSRGNPFP